MKDLFLHKEKVSNNKGFNLTKWLKDKLTDLKVIVSEDCCPCDTVTGIKYDKQLGILVRYNCTTKEWEVI